MNKLFLVFIFLFFSCIKQDKFSQKDLRIFPYTNIDGIDIDNDIRKVYENIDSFLEDEFIPELVVINSNNRYFFKTYYSGNFVSGYSIRNLTDSVDYKINKSNIPFPIVIYLDDIYMPNIYNVATDAVSVDRAIFKKISVSP